MKKTTKTTTPAAPALDLAAAAKVVTAETTFKTFAIAAGATWPVQQSDPAYKALVEAFSAARKAVIQEGAKRINEPTKKEAKPKAKATVSLKPSAAKASKATKPAADDVTLSEAEIEAIEAEVRSKTIRPCGCGCGVETRASFLPGHDAKLRSRLIAEAKARKAKGAKAAA